jgi:C terminal of Calcineurin-like phosphoesterase/N terminal of Calcineurin-like phosphoesterase
MPTRRDFLSRALAAGAGLSLVPAAVLADPYRPALHRAPWGVPIRIRGRVASGGRGLPGVRVSDGFDVTLTNADGTYELLSSDRQRFVFVSVPSGYAIPVSDSGTARFFKTVVANGTGEMTVDFALKPGPDDSEHAFLAVGDTQTQTPFEMGRLHAESVPDMQRTIARLGARTSFGLACGDIMFDDLSLYPEYERAVRDIGIPFFQAVGNHDLDLDAGTDPDSVRTFERFFGPSYYSFDRGEVHYVVLDDVLWHASGYIGHIGAEQFTWLSRDLKSLEAGRTVVVFLHIPGLSTGEFRKGNTRASVTNSLTNREHLYRLLEPWNAHLISGHTHENEHVMEGGVHEHVLGTTCGAWWSGEICHDGTPNGYAVYEVSGSAVSWRYKGTGLPSTAQMRAYGPGADSARPDEAIINVWDWDPAWEVVWMEDGVQRGALESRVGRDPLAIARFDGPDKPSHRPWVQPALTNHLLYADVSSAAGSIVIQATDRFGRVYGLQLR